MIKYVNVYKNSLSVAYNTPEIAYKYKAKCKFPDKCTTRAIFIDNNGVITDITDIMENALNKNSKTTGI